MSKRSPYSRETYCRAGTIVNAARSYERCHDNLIHAYAARLAALRRGEREAADRLMPGVLEAQWSLSAAWRVLTSVLPTCETTRVDDVLYHPTVLPDFRTAFLRIPLKCCPDLAGPRPTTDEADPDLDSLANRPHVIDDRQPD